MSIAEFIQLNLIESSAAVGILMLWVVVEIALTKRRGKVISNQELIRLINHENPVLIDLRPEKEFQGGHILNSVCLDLKRLKDQFDQFVKDGSRPVVFLCQYGVKSGHAAQSLYENGVRNLYRLKGGLVGWESENLPLRKGKS
ncbi:MAG: rhodanese-like domain-containing protein [Gammaproteobacteria bacterium]|nr:rhodanese-like domain-containing protein [Pseudomonadota bacterium]MCH9663926.1 rhodanese-like domain-containing protein [Gammaproteobacteria bacterium]